MEAFEGPSHLSSTSSSTAIQRCVSLLAARKQLPTSSERAYMILKLLNAVGKLHTRGSAHGKLHPQLLMME